MSQRKESTKTNKKDVPKHKSDNKNGELFVSKKVVNLGDSNGKCGTCGCPSKIIQEVTIKIEMLNPCNGSGTDGEHTKNGVGGIGENDNGEIPRGGLYRCDANNAEGECQNDAKGGNESEKEPDGEMNQKRNPLETGNETVTLTPEELAACENTTDKAACIHDLEQEKLKHQNKVIEESEGSHFANQTNPCAAELENRTVYTLCKEETFPDLQTTKITKKQLVIEKCLPKCKQLCCPSTDIPTDLCKLQELVEVKPLSKTGTDRPSFSSCMNPRKDDIELDENNNVRINWKKVIKYLTTACPSRKMKLLQAIRWRITKVDQKTQEKTLRDMEKYDIFGIKFECPERSLLDDLLWPLCVGMPHPLQDCTARLLNAIVSTKLGRDYLDGTSVINSLVWGETSDAAPFQIYNRFPLECHATDMLISSMMKLSLSLFQRKDMIRKGLLKWLINHLQQVEQTASNYHLEYGTALLMMLLTFNVSPDLILEQSNQLLCLLIRCLQSEVTTCWPYVRASLLALLRCQKIAAAAKNLNLGIILDHVFKNTTCAQEKKEIQNIIYCLDHPAQAHAADIEKCVITLANNKIYLDEEIESYDPIIGIGGCICGEELLSMKFSCRMPKCKTAPKDETHICRKDLIEIDNLMVKSFNETTHSFDKPPNKNTVFPTKKICGSYRHMRDTRKCPSWHDVSEIKDRIKVCDPYIDKCKKRCCPCERQNNEN